MVWKGKSGKIFEMNDRNSILTERAIYQGFTIRNITQSKDGRYNISEDKCKNIEHR